MVTIAVCEERAQVELLNIVCNSPQNIVLVANDTDTPTGHIYEQVRLSSYAHSLVSFRRTLKFVSK